MAASGLPPWSLRTRRGGDRRRGRGRTMGDELPSRLATRPWSSPSAIVGGNAATTTATSSLTLSVLMACFAVATTPVMAAAEACFALPRSSSARFKSSLVVTTRRSPQTMRARRRGGGFDDDYDDYDDDYLDDDEYFDRRRRRRGPPSGGGARRPSVDDLGGGGEGDEGLNLPSPFGRRRGLRLPESLSKALLAAVFVLGIGTGVTVDSAINTDERDLASRDAIDRNAPNPTLCTSYGASAMAFDTRVFVTFDPFDVYVAQADVKPSCVLRPSNVVPVLRDRKKLINDSEIRACKANMNTWAFVGDLDDVPQLSCVYKSDDAQNEFLSGDPRLGVGEDVWDDDRASGRLKGNTRKMVKDARTAAQNEEIRKKMKMSGESE